MNQEFPIWHLVVNEHLDKLLLLFNEIESSLIQFLECLDDHRLSEQVYQEKIRVQDPGFKHSHGCILGHFRLGRAERLVPPSGGPRERCPFLFADRRRPAALCLRKHCTGWFQFHRTRLRHRVRGA